MGNASMGWAGQFGAGATSPVTNQFEVLSCALGKRPALVESPGLRGTRSHQAAGVTLGHYAVSGEVLLEPRPDDLDFWLPYILGGAESANTFPLAEALPEFYATVDKVAKVYAYAGCKINRAVFASADGADPNLKLTLEIEGKTETEGNAGTFPSISGTLSALQPYTHLQAVLTVLSNPRPIKNVQVEIHNALVLDRFMNSLTRTELPPGDRVVRLLCDNPFTTDEVALYNLALTGASGTLVYTNGARSLSFSFANLKAATPGPGLAGRGAEIPLRLEFQAFQSGATKELVVTNVS